MFTPSPTHLSATCISLTKMYSSIVLLMGRACRAGEAPLEIQFCIQRFEGRRMVESNLNGRSACAASQIQLMQREWERRMEVRQYIYRVSISKTNSGLPEMLAIHSTPRPHRVHNYDRSGAPFSLEYLTLSNIRPSVCRKEI